MSWKLTKDSDIQIIWHKKISQLQEIIIIIIISLLLFVSQREVFQIQECGGSEVHVPVHSGVLLYTRTLPFQKDQQGSWSGASKSAVLIPALHISAVSQLQHTWLKWTDQLISSSAHQLVSEVCRSLWMSRSFQRADYEPTCQNTRTKDHSWFIYHHIKQRKSWFWKVDTKLKGCFLFLRKIPGKPPSAEELLHVTKWKFYFLPPFKSTSNHWTGFALSKFKKNYKEYFLTVSS